MGSELPGGNRGKNRAGKKIVNNEDRSTNKIYASGEISALGKNKTIADSTMKAEELEGLPKGNATPTQKSDDKSADKYYANGGSNRVRQRAGAKKPVANRPLGPAPRLPNAPVPRAASATGLLLVTDKTQINGVCSAACDRVKATEEPVVVYIKKGDSQLLKRVRANLDLLVTREVVTEEQYRDIRLSYEIDGTEAKVVPPEPVATKKADAPVTQDPLDFLNADDDGDEVIDTSPVVPTEFDTSADRKDAETAAVEAEVKATDTILTTVPVTDDDEGDDFLAPKTEPAAVETATETPALTDTAETPVTPPVEKPIDDEDDLRPEYDLTKLIPVPDARKPKGKRHGRGS